MSVLSPLLWCLGYGWMGDTRAGTWSSGARRARNFRCFYLSPFHLRLVPKNLILMLRPICVLVTLPGTGEG